MKILSHTLASGGKLGLLFLVGAAGLVPKLLEA